MRAALATRSQPRSSAHHSLSPSLAVGRSGWPGHESAAQESAWSRDGLVKGLKTELSGDPGHYNPYLYSNLFRTKRTSKVRRAFAQSSMS